MLCVLVPAMEVRADVSAAGVQRAIDRGVAYLRKMQTERGGWDEFAGYSCGQSALCTLALLNCGIEKDDPAVARAMKYLRSFEPDETYSVALQTLVYCQLGAAGDLPRIRRNVKWLVASQLTAGVDPDSVGAWNYGSGRGGAGGPGDPSNAQFALLALGAAEERGIEVDPKTFELAMDYWVRRQRSGGGWSYNTRDVSGSMTCAGVASIIISRGRLGGRTSSIVGDQVRCCGGDLDEKDAVEEGLTWLGRNFSTQVNPGGNLMTFYYYIYALERVGRLSGRRFIGEHDWYRVGAERLIALQDEFLGYWKGSGPLEPEAVATSFALLFLSKGKRQVVVGRLRYPDTESSTLWKRHPDGMRQLVRHVEREWGRDLTWQTIDSESAGLADLLQTPVLVISGNRPLSLSDDTAENLRKYLDQGGTILFEADGGDGCGDASGFERSVNRLCSEWFDGQTLDRLPPDHPVWFAERKVDPMMMGEDFWMYGVQACCRTSVFYSPRSLSCRWELSDSLFRRAASAGPAQSQAAQAQVDTAVRLGENVIAYATGRELKDKLESRFVIGGESDVELTRGTIQLAALGIDAGGQEARRALPNAASLISSRVPLSIRVAAEPVGFDSKALSDVQFLWIHGRTDFTLDDPQRKVLRDFVENDGMILGSSVCGGDGFTEAFRRELKRIFPDSPLHAIADDHPILNASGGFDVSNVTIRTPADGGRGVGKRIGRPLIEVAMVNDVEAVFFSPLDLSCALESPNSVQCPGYGTEDAAKIVANLLLYGLQQ